MFYCCLVSLCCFFFFFKQKTAYEMRISDWSSDVCSSDLSIAGVKLLQEGGTITAATSSQICDGASAVLVVSEQALKDHGLTPSARIHHVSVTAGDPVIMLEEPLFATERALTKAGMRLGDRKSTRRNSSH